MINNYVILDVSYKRGRHVRGSYPVQPILRQKVEHPAKSAKEANVVEMPMSTPVVEKIIGAIADAEGTDPSELDMVLYDRVDVDAIRELVDHDGDSWELQFEVPDHNVTVTGDGAVRVDGVQRRTVKAD